MDSVTIERLQKLKLEDGDILHVTVSPTTQMGQAARFQQQLTDRVKHDLHVDVVVVVLLAECTMSIVKRNELSDIYQRLDDLEERMLPNLDTRLDALEHPKG